MKNENNAATAGVAAQASCSHPMLDEAGVKVGDVVTWTPRLPITKQPPRQMTVKGIHFGKHAINEGKPAIEVVDEKGNGFRAYPSEITPSDANSPAEERP